MLSDIDLIYTGGTGNSDPLLSLGGLQGNAISQQTVAWTSTSQAGITLTESDGFTATYNLIIYNDATIVLQDPVTEFYGDAIAPTVDGDYYLQTNINANQPYAWLKITIDYDVFFAGKPSSLANLGLSFTQDVGGLLQSITPTQSELGQTKYVCFMLHNNTSDTLDVELHINNHNSPATIAIGLDPVAVGTNPTATTSDGDTAPTGVTFTEPDSTSKLTVPQLLTDEMQPVWLRSSISAFNLLSAEPAFFKMNFDVVVS